MTSEDILHYVSIDIEIFIRSVFKQKRYIRKSKFLDKKLTL